MATKLHFHMRVAKLALMRRIIAPETIARDYDRLSTGYDDHFGRHVAKHSLRLIERLSIPRGARVLDLAAGTGTLTLPLAEAVGPEGEVVSVDRSEGMQAEACRKARERGLGNIRFVCGDMLVAAESMPPESFDFATCGWAIGYVNPSRLLKRMARTLRPGGCLGIIENLRHTLHPVHHSSLRVVKSLPGELLQLMDLHSRLPRSKEHLGQLFAGAGLGTQSLWDGQEPFRFGSGREVLDWVLHTGAAAGFGRMMEPTAKEKCDSLFVEYIEEDFMVNGTIEVAHCYAAGIARKGD